MASTQSARPKGRHPERGGRERHGLSLGTLFFAVVLVAGLCLVLYPTVSDWWNRYHESRAVAGYIEKVADTSAADRQKEMAAARAYNETLVGRGLSRFNLTSGQKKEYEKLLDTTNTGIMGYVTIPKIAVRLPLYHGTSDTVLQVAVGHLPGSSLPVGGASTHAVVSGHTGLPSARLLTGLDELRKGDTFAFHVLGETFTYKVDQISVVLPDQLSKLAISNGKDEATLITCTPYGINTHRLLVRGHRIPNPMADTTVYDTPDEMIRTVALIGAFVLAGLELVLLGAKSRRRFIVLAGMHAPYGQHNGGVYGTRNDVKGAEQ
ncbi:MAG: class C sortase [Bifidobacteriaceae bacterium]|jgi:sortase A|nr:class C sortase [Bifidobacteriaceae bacterium]